jgi:hypothetical protein
MRANFSMNPYLFGCLILTAVWALVLAIVCLYRSSRERREFWWGSIVCSLLGFSEPLFVPEYWDPPSVLSYYRWDLESFIFCFAIGGISAVAPEWHLWRECFQAVDRCVWRFVRWCLTPFRRLTGTHSNARDEVFLTQEELRRENALLMAVFLGAFGFTAHAGLNIIYDSALACAAMAVYISWRRPRLRWQVWSGGLMFMMIYTGILLVVGHRYPSFYVDHWNIEALSGLWVFRAPIEEYLFAGTLGTFWAPLYEAWRNERQSPSEMDLSPSNAGYEALANRDNIHRLND